MCVLYLDNLWLINSFVQDFWLFITQNSLGNEKTESLRFFFFTHVRQLLEKINQY